MAAKYIGVTPGVVRIEDRPVLPNDTIAGPPDVVAELLKRGDFVATAAAADLEKANDEEK